MKVRKLTLPVLIVVMIICLTYFFLPIHKVFTFTDYRSDHPKPFYVKLEDEMKFQIRYVHSIFLTDVIENYEITNDNAIRLLSMRYEDVGIGLPGFAEDGETIEFKDGKYTLTYKENIIDSFVLFVGDVDADLAFIYKGKEIDLKAYLTKGKSYAFKVKRQSMYQKMRGVSMNGEK